MIRALFLIVALGTSASAQPVLEPPTLPDFSPFADIRTAPVAAPDSDPALPSPDADDADIRSTAVDILAKGLARAASQDLVRTAPEIPPPAPPGQGVGSLANLTLETSLDRAIGTRRAEDGTASDGSPCPPESWTDITLWGHADDPWSALRDARRGTLGPDGRLTPDALIALARAYAYLGFGLEALQAAADAGDTEDVATLRSIARLLDAVETTDAPLTPYADCPGPAALWAALSAPPETAVFPDDLIATYQSLPRHLRKALAQRLAAAARAADNLEAARIVLSDADRSGFDGARALDLEAEVMLETTGGTPGYGRLTSQTDLVATRALVRDLAYRIDTGGTLTAEEIADAEALARATEGAAEAVELAQMELLARIASGDLLGAAARLTERRLRRHYSDVDRTRVLTALWQQASLTDDDTLLHLAVAFPDSDDSDALPVPDRLALARRWHDVGLTDRAAALIADLPATESRRTLESDIAIRSGAEPERLAVLLDTLSTPEPRAALQTALGRHADAARSLRAAGQPRAADIAALRDGDFAAVSDDVFAAAAAPPATGTADSNAALLEAARTESQSVRDILSAIDALAP